jgi:hypothetical protein
MPSRLVLCPGVQAATPIGLRQISVHRGGREDEGSDGLGRLAAWAGLSPKLRVVVSPEVPGGFAIGASQEPDLCTDLCTRRGGTG